MNRIQECPICYETTVCISPPRGCSHYACKSCWLKVDKCFMCRRPKPNGFGQTIESMIDVHRGSYRMYSWGDDAKEEDMCNPEYVRVLHITFPADYSDIVKYVNLNELSFDFSRIDLNIRRDLLSVDILEKIATINSLTILGICGGEGVDLSPLLNCQKFPRLDIRDTQIVNLRTFIGHNKRYNNLGGNTFTK